MTTSIPGGTTSSPNCSSGTGVGGVGMGVGGLQGSSKRPSVSGRRGHDRPSRELRTLSVLCPVDWRLGSPCFPRGTQSRPDFQGLEAKLYRANSTAPGSVLNGMLSAHWWSHSWKILPFRWKSAISPPLEQVPSLPFSSQENRGLVSSSDLLKDTELFGLRTLLSHLTPGGHTHLLPRTGWCHLENSFWVINQKPLRGRKINGVLGIFSQKTGKQPIWSTV